MNDSVKIALAVVAAVALFLILRARSPSNVTIGNISPTLGGAGGNTAPTLGESLTDALAILKNQPLASGTTTAATQGPLEQYFSTLRSLFRGSTSSTPVLIR